MERAFQVGSSIYTTNGSYTNMLTTENGCDSIVNLSLTVNPVYTIDLNESICSGETFQVGNSTYSSSGNYTDVLTTVDGCDSTVNLTLTVHPVYLADVYEFICEGESVTIGTSTYTTSGNYTDILTSVNGCDSTVNLNLTVNPVYTENITEIICEGESVSIGTSTYTTSGNYTDVLTTVNGCDSTVNLSLTVHPAYTENITEIICEGESVTIGTSTYTTSGNYTDILTTENGCDSTLNLSLTVNPVYTENITEIICEGESVQVGSSIYTTSGNYTDILTTVNGCDSTVNLNLTVHPAYTENITQEICEGESVQIGTSIYTTTGNYTDLLSTVNGCDSVVNLTLTVHPNYDINLSESICQGETITVGSNTYNTSGNYSDLLSSVNGCDSLVNLELTVHPIYNINISQTICEGESVQVGGSIYTSSGVYNDILSTVNGCDSVVNLNLTVHPVYSINLTETICEGESIQIGNSTYTNSGNYNDILSTVNGCDSIVNLNLTVLEIEEETLNIELCDGGSYGGIIYATDTTMVDTLVSSVGCDSILTTNIFVYPVYDETISVEICEGEDYLGITYYTDATIVENLTTVNGCDSIVTTNISVTPSKYETLNVNLCYGEIYEGVSYTSDIILVDNYVSAEGCDSIVTTQITVEPEQITNLVEIICEGDSFVVGGTSYSATGSYTEVLSAGNGCDSTVNLTLTVLEIEEDTVEIVLCSGESYDGTIYTSDATLVNTFSTTAGCDSIVTTNVLVNPVYDQILHSSSL